MIYSLMFLDYRCETLYVREYILLLSHIHDPLLTMNPV